MAFDYRTLKQLSTEDIVDGSLEKTELANGVGISRTVANSAVGDTKLANSSVDLGGNKVTGTLGVGSGGTGLTSAGSNLEVLRVNGAGNALEYSRIGINAIRAYQGNSTWNRPAGVRYVHVQVVGGGGGGSGHGESGGAGGYAEEIINVESISSVSISIGSRGGSSYYSGAGGNGGSTSFGPYCSAGGGFGANRNNQHSGGVSGVGSGGNLNIHGGGGGNHTESSGPGGSSFWGGNTAMGHPQGGQFTYNHRNHAAPGSGGTGGYFYGNRGAIGRNGMVVVTEYR